MTNITEIKDPIQVAIDTFVGFVYATSIALLVRSAYFESKFDSPIPVALTLVLLMFFAQDWMFRFRGRQKMSGNMGDTAKYYFSKLFFDIAIIYILLLASLKLIETYSLVTLANIVSVSYSASAWVILTGFLGLFIDREAGCMIAVFAIMSGLWNSVMIAILIPVIKGHVRSIFRGHLEDEVIEQFPDIEKRIRKYKEDVDSKLKQGSDTNIPCVLGVALRYLIRKPHHLLLPYFFTFHVVVLNYILGIFILLSTLLLHGESIISWEMQPFLFFILIFTLMALAYLLLAIHFSYNERPIYIERLACSCIAITILLLYSVLPMVFLVLCVAIQQIAANYVMSKYFEPSGRNEGKNEPLEEEPKPSTGEGVGSTA